MYAETCTSSLSFRCGRDTNRFSLVVCSLAGKHGSYSMHFTTPCNGLHEKSIVKESAGSQRYLQEGTYNTYMHDQLCKPCNNTGT